MRFQFARDATGRSDDILLSNESIFPDYVIGQNACALFLSLRYHTLNPNYIHERLKQLGSRTYNLRVRFLDWYFLVLKVFCGWDK